MKYLSKGRLFALYGVAIIIHIIAFETWNIVSSPERFVSFCIITIVWALLYILFEAREKKDEEKDEKKEGARVFVRHIIIDQEFQKLTNEEQIKECIKKGKS